MITNLLYNPSDTFQHILAYFSIFWHFPAYSGIFWHIPASSSIFWHILTSPGTFWHILVSELKIQIFYSFHHQLLQFNLLCLQQELLLVKCLAMTLYYSCKICLRFLFDWTIVDSHMIAAPLWYWTESLTYNSFQISFLIKSKIIALTFF